MEYTALLTKNLKELPYKDFNINTCPTCCLLNDDKKSFALCRWVSPKRTRSYPLERIYNLLGYSKKIAVIPIVKDEGITGDRDFLQWDTISLMSLLDVYVILAFYDSAQVKGTKLTKQKFNNQYVCSKIKEIESYHSSALHWNLQETTQTLPQLVTKLIDISQSISSKTGIQLHSEKGLKSFVSQIQKDVSCFKDFSRRKAQQAQHRESKTDQPKEFVFSNTKSKISIFNYLGGAYYFTTDEIELFNQNLFIIEDKHSNASLLPSLSDIKDGLLKMVLYSNLTHAEVNGKKMKIIPILSLTSGRIKGIISSKDPSVKQSNFMKCHPFSVSQQNIIKTLLNEAKKNGFILEIKSAKHDKKPVKIPRR